MDKIPLLLWIEAVIVTIFSLPTLIFFKYYLKFFIFNQKKKRDYPPTPPSFSAESKKEENFFYSVKIIFKNINFWILFFEFGISLGAYNTLATILNELMVPFNYHVKFINNYFFIIIIRIKVE